MIKAYLVPVQLPPNAQQAKIVPRSVTFYRPQETRPKWMFENAMKFAVIVWPQGKWMFRIGMKDQRMHYYVCTALPPQVVHALDLMGCRLAGPNDGYIDRMSSQLWRADGFLFGCEFTWFEDNSYEAASWTKGASGKPNSREYLAHFYAEASHASETLRNWCNRMIIT